MKVHHLFADEDGESHFRDLAIDWTASSRDGTLSAPVAVKTLVFRSTPADYFNDWHNPPRKQFVINLDAAVEITASDGESRIIGPGEVLLLEDVTGKGHLGRAVDGRIRHSILVALD
ncbi:MAG: hypothetical protein SFW09_22760 [Hyphomicrobiaceae bacterium]|nr:hypothetical protein [Hyphomicrobiaceae bacterium]